MIKKKKNPKLDAYEQEIEDNFESLKSLENQQDLRAELKKAAKKHIQK